MNRYKIPIIMIAGCLFLLTACGKVQTETEPNEPVATEDTASATADDEQTTQEDESDIIPNLCPTTELSLKKEKHTLKETRLGVPGYSNYFYLKNNSEIIADDWRSIEMDPPAISFVLSENRWEEKETPFDIARKNGKISSVSCVTQRANGDYIFINGSSEIVRMTKKGDIKYRITSSQLFSRGRLLASMVYLGGGKAIVQSQDDFFDTSIYEEQNDSIVHLDYVNLKTGLIEKTYPDGWRLCGSTDENSFYAENKKRVAKIMIDTGEFVNKYSTEAIWSQGWDDGTTDDDGKFFHDYAITWSTFDGALYAKHVGGIFRLDEENPCWEQLISLKDGFTMGPMYNNIFVLLDKNTALLMAYRGDDECATDCCLYEWE